MKNRTTPIKLSKSGKKTIELLESCRRVIRLWEEIHEEIHDEVALDYNIRRLEESVKRFKNDL